MPILELILRKLFTQARFEAGPPDARSGLHTFLTSRGTHNLASFGTFPRILGRYSRDLKLFPLEEAVRRMTSFSAERTGLTGVGRIAEGFWADLVLFDPQTVADRTTPEQPNARRRASVWCSLAGALSPGTEKCCPARTLFAFCVVKMPGL
jgi:N-acyl-D-aspartate/D-glutamate deacylase